MNPTSNTAEKRMKPWGLFLVGTLPFLLVSCGRAVPVSVQEGDLIFQTSRSAQSTAIQKATHSPYSHMGVVLFRDSKPYVFEAVATVRYTPLEKWVNRGEGHHYVVKRLSTAARVLTNDDIKQLHLQADSFQNKPYDLTFEWNDERIYCSELVWKLYDRAVHIHIGETQKLKEFELDEPVVAAKLHERYGNSIPLDETVISPAAMFNSSLLVTVKSQ